MRNKVRIEIEENVVVSLAKLKSLQIYLHSNHFFQDEKRILPSVNWLEHAVHAYFTARTKCEHILIPVRTNASAPIADALNSAGETRAEKCVCSPHAKQTLVEGERLRDEPKERLPRRLEASEVPTQRSCPILPSLNGRGDLKRG